MAQVYRANLARQHILNNLNVRQLRTIATASAIMIDRHPRAQPYRDALRNRTPQEINIPERIARTFPITIAQLREIGYILHDAHGTQRATTHRRRGRNATNNPRRRRYRQVVIVQNNNQQNNNQQNQQNNILQRNPTPRTYAQISQATNFNPAQTPVHTDPENYPIDFFGNTYHSWITKIRIPATRLHLIVTLCVELVNGIIGGNFNMTFTSDLWLQPGETDATAEQRFVANNFLRYARIGLCSTHKHPQDDNFRVYGIARRINGVLFYNHGQYWQYQQSNLTQQQRQRIQARALIQNTPDYVDDNQYLQAFRVWWGTDFRGRN